MLPVLFTVGSISISSFGFALSLGFIYGVFLVWRLSRAWDLDEEKILDLALLTFLGGLIGSRIYFIIDHFNLFGADVLKMILITKYPGFSLWGAFLGGWVVFAFFVRKFKMDFFQLADIASVGLLGGLIFGNLGCFLGGCDAGIPSNFLGVDMVGLIDKRFPVQLLEALIFIFLLVIIWPKAIRFHANGKIVSLVLIGIGLVKFALEFLKVSDTGGYIFEVSLIILGVIFSYRLSKRSFMADIKAWPKTLLSFLIDSQFRKRVVQNTIQSWYNLIRLIFKNRKIVWNIKWQKFNRILRKLHVRTYPNNLK